MTNLILREKIARMSDVKSNPAKTLKGFVRVVAEGKGAATRGFFFDKDAFEDFLENMEYSTQEFWKEIGASRKSGTVSSKSVEKRLGLI
ncbi:MAG: hypothetical protein GXP44_02290 [bacterium]|nr:hypothetical protein [bacterium]